MEEDAGARVVTGQVWAEFRDALKAVRRCGVRASTTHPEDDGSVQIVVAHRHPGAPSWLRMAGHQRGVLGTRRVGRDVVDVVPSTPLVSVRPSS